MADETTSGAPFDEQIKISLDVASLEGQFTKVADLWKATLAEMGSSAPGLLQTINTSSINTQLKELSDTLTGFVDNFQASFGEIGATINKAMAEAKVSVDQALSPSSKGTASGVSKFQQDLEIEQEGVINAAKTTASKQIQIARDLEIEQEGIVNAKAAAEEKAADRALAAWEKKNERERALAQEIAQEQQAILEEYSRNQEAAYAKLYADRDLNENALAKHNNALRNEEIRPTGGPGSDADLAALNRQLAAEEKLGAARAKFARDLAIEQEGVVNAHQTANDKMASSDDKLFEQTRRKYEKLAADRKKIEEEFLAAQYKAENEAAQRSSELHSNVFHGINPGGQNENANADRQQLSNYFADLQNTEQNSPLSSSARFSKSLLKDLPELIAQVVRYQFGWALIGTAIDAVGEALKLPFQLIERGVAELTLLEDKATELSGVLGSSFNFSSDFAKNLQLAAGYSKTVADELQNVAAQSGLKFESLVNVFKIFSNSGIGSFTTDLGQVVQLTQQFTTLLHAGGLESENSRRLISEIPKLLNGSVKEGDLFLTTLNLTKDQWNAIVAQAKEHGDLVQRLAPYIQPYVQQLEATKGTLSSLKEQFKEALDADSAQLAAGVFEQMKTSLQAFIELLRDSKIEFHDLGVLIGGVVQALVHMVDTVHLFSSDIGDLGSPFKNVVGYVERMTAGFGVMVEVAGFLLKQLDTFEEKVTKNLRGLNQASTGIGQIASGHLMDGATSIAQSALTFKENPDKDLDEARKGRDARIKAIQENYATAIANLRSAESLKDTGVDLASARFDGGKNPPPSTAKKTNPGNDLALLREEMQDRVSLVKESTQAGMDMAKEDFAARKIGEQELHDFVILLLQDEKKQVNEIMGAYKEAVTGAANVKPREREKALDAAGRLQGTLNSSIDHQITQSNIQLDNEQYADKTKMLQQQYDFEAKIAQQSIELARRSGASQQEIVRLQSAANEKEYSNRRHLLELELEEYKNVAEKKVQIQQRIDQLDSAHSSSSKIDAQSLVNARVKDDTLAAQQQHTAQQADFEAARRQATDSQLGDVDPQQRRDRITGLAVAYEQMTRSQLASIANIKKEAEAWGADAAIIKELTALYQKASAEERGAQFNLKKAQDDSKVGGDFLEKVFGSGVRKLGDFGKKQTTDEDGNAVVKFDAGTAAEELSSAFQVFGGQVSTIINAFKSGGALKGLGALGKTVGADLSAAGLPVAGAIVSMAGEVATLISDAFTSAARKIGDNIKKSFDITMRTFQDGGATLNTTIQSIQAEQAKAIAQLSGKKGGQQQLDQILPGLQEQLLSLQKQAAQTQLNFMLNLSKLDQGNFEPLNGMIDLWTQINKQVQDYISAGGDAANAQRFVSESLANYRKELASQFTSENLQAVQDAEQLNDLLQQRIDLEKQYAQQQFQTVNADSLERRASNAITTGTTLQQQQAAYNLQLQKLNNEVSLTQQKVDAEKKIFDLANSTQDLQIQSNALQIKQLNEQLEIYKQQKLVLDNIVQDAGGGTLITKFLSTLFGQGNISTPGSPIVINVTVGSGTDPNDTKNAVLDALNQAGRYGTGTDVQTFYN